MPHKDGQKVLVIAGMHRSGTSLISQWLSKCGLNIGETLVGPHFSNTEGHFEDVDFYRFHEDVLLSNNLPHTGLTDRHLDELTYYQREKIKSIIAFKNRMHAEWGWKEPRTCLFLSTYREFIPKAYYLIIVRDYECVISSLINRDFKEIEKKYLSRKWISRSEWKIFRRAKRLKKLLREQAEYYLKVWINYSEELLNLIRCTPEGRFMVVNYEQLIEDDAVVFNKLRNGWNFTLTYSAFKNTFKKNMLGKDLQIISYIDNKPLLEKANQLQETLRNYIISEYGQQGYAHLEMEEQRSNYN